MPTPDEIADQEEQQKRVAAMLAGDDMGDQVPLDVDPEIAERLAHAQHLRDKVAEDEIPPHENEYVENPEVDIKAEDITPDMVRRRAVQQSALLPELTDADKEVNDLEKILYRKSLLFDQELVLEIKLPIGASMKIRSLSGAEQDILGHALQYGILEQKIFGPDEYATHIQRMAVRMQILELEGAQLDGVRFPDTAARNKESGKVLFEESETFYHQTNWTRWNMYLLGLRIFEAKLTECNRRQNDPKWWPAEGNG